MDVYVTTKNTFQINGFIGYRKIFRVQTVKIPFQLESFSFAFYIGKIIEIHTLGLRSLRLLASI